MATGSRQWRAAGFAVATSLLLVGAGGRMFGWSSVSSAASTHQYILREAYANLQADPGYHRGTFPALADILAHEGVTTTAALDLTGPGPDATTPYSWHYYNARRTEGRGPAAVACYFALLQRALSNHAETGRPAACGPLGSEVAALSGSPAKWAAYLAHFVADLSVPYHTNGMMASTMTSGRTTAPEGVFPKDRGAAVWPGAFDVWNDLKAKPDWFDPWYWDIPRTQGLPGLAKQAISTHAAWERDAAGSSAAAISSAFTPRIASAAAANGRVTAADIADFARWRASTSLMLDAGRMIPPEKGLEPGSELRLASISPAPLLAQAIQDVHTAWRAAFSALRPSIDIAFNQETGAQDVTVTVENSDATAVREVSVSCELVTGAGNLSGPKGMTLARPIAPRSTYAVRELWAVGPLGPRFRLRATVLGRFDRTPDSGDAIIERDFELPTQTAVVSVVEAGTMKTGAEGVAKARGLAAKVTLTPVSGGPATSQETDQTGSARFDSVVMGIYRASATAANHEPGEARVVVDARLPRALATISLAVSNAAVPGAVQQAMKQALPALEDLPAGIIWQRKAVDYGEARAAILYEGSQKADPYEFRYEFRSVVAKATPEQIDEYSKELPAALQQTGVKPYPGLPNSFARREGPWAYHVTAPRGRSFVVQTYFTCVPRSNIVYPEEKDTRGLTFEEKQREAYKRYLEQRKAESDQMKFEEWARSKMSERSSFALAEAGRLATVTWSRLPADALGK